MNVIVERRTLCLQSLYIGPQLSVQNNSLGVSPKAGDRIADYSEEKVVSDETGSPSSPRKS